MARKIEMANMTPIEPQFANDYDDRSTAAVKSVLIEIGQILGSFKGKFALGQAPVKGLSSIDSEQAAVLTSLKVKKPTTDVDYVNL